MISVSVPATSANLAVGFDVLGLALDLKAHFTFEMSTQKLEIIGDDPAFANSENLIYQAFSKFAEAIDQPVPNLRIVVDSAVPSARGLGSSAICVVCGIAAANAWYQAGWDDTALLRFATEMEGHPDNAAPAIYGQLCATIMAQNEPVVRQYTVSSKLHFVTLIPDYAVSTADARRILPRTMTYADATYQMGRCTLMTRALADGDMSLLRQVATDRMQEPYRAELIPDYSAAHQVVQTAGGVLLISGSGSTMLAITDSFAAAAQVQAQAQESWKKWQVQVVAPSQQGVQVEQFE
ncbi:homoserine kinase [Lacticaseibacillus paracasei]|uniref:homoserine kinase n=1 Tax=Lacticaseibacillus paracasei TaxID=1597 RepID=UPI0031F70D5B